MNARTVDLLAQIAGSGDAGQTDLTAFIPYIQAVREHIQGSGRVKKPIIAIEQDYQLVELAHDMVAKGFLTPRLEIFPLTLGEFLTSPPAGAAQSYSLVAFFKTDPQMWSDGFTGCSQKVDLFSKTGKIPADYVGKRYLDIDAGVKALLPAINSPGQLLITVGSGNVDIDRTELHQRILFLKILNQVLANHHMQPQLYYFWDFNKMVSHLPYPAYGDMGMVVGTKR